MSKKETRYPPKEAIKPPPPPAPPKYKKSIKVMQLELRDKK